jgi:hypothetical protein
MPGPLLSGWTKCRCQSRSRNTLHSESGEAVPPRESELPNRSNGVAEIAAALNALLADTFALYIKTKNFHWQLSGLHFRDYHLLLDEQADHGKCCAASRRYSTSSQKYTELCSRPQLRVI